MTKLLITDITRMRETFCVIGLAREGKQLYSLRPVPRGGGGWAYFPHRRGDILELSLMQLPANGPHFEDRVSTRGMKKAGQATESETVGYLRRAETGGSLQDLFGCSVHENRTGSGSYVAPQDANRSICGCEPQNLRVELCGQELRAWVTLPSGEVLRDLPFVDRDWNEFIDAAKDPNRGANRTKRLEGFLQARLQQEILSCPFHYVRIGLTRPMNWGMCWLMLDTLFPLPQSNWLEEF
jgi:hypothetical protein